MSTLFFLSNVSYWLDQDLIILLDEPRCKSFKKYSFHLIHASDEICFHINLVPQFKGCENGEQLDKEGDAEEDSNQGYETSENNEKFVNKKQNNKLLNQIYLDS